MPQSPTSLKLPKYRADIDGLRAIAILLVVFFHAFEEILPSGFIGVDIFFVISGFLISTILFENISDGSFRFRDFYFRRIRRLFPVLLTVVICCLFWGWFALSAEEYEHLGKHAAGGLGFVSNLVLINEAGYFSFDAKLQPLIHFWSIGVEEQFYLLWPFLVWMAWKSKIKFSTLVLVVGIASFIFSVVSLSHGRIFTFYSPLTRLWELLIGSMLALRPKWILPKKWYSLLGFIIILSGLWFINKNSYSANWALLPTLGAFLIISSGPDGWLNKNILSSKYLVGIGLISFPLYLWHWPLLTFVRIWNGGTPSLEIRFLVLGTSFALAALSYLFLEKPIRRTENPKVVYGLLIPTFIFGLFGWLIFRQHGFENRSALKGLSKEATAQFVGDKWPYNFNEICTKKYPFPQNCIMRRDSDPTLVLLGHSYANQYYPGFANNAQLSQQNILSIGNCDVGMAKTTKIESSHPCYGIHLQEHSDYINTLIEKNDSLKYVIIAGLSTKPKKRYIERVKERIRLLRKYHKNVIVFTPHLESAFDPRECYGRPMRRSVRDCSFPVAYKLIQRQNFQPLVDAISASFPEVLFFDPNEMYCQGEQCSFIHQGLPLLRDDGHLSEYGSLMVQKYFSAWAKLNIPEILDH